jgi:hypothetical protein
LGSVRKTTYLSLNISTNGKPQHRNNHYTLFETVTLDWNSANNNQGGGSYIPPVNFTNHGGGATPTGPAITYLAPKINPTQGIIGLIIVGLIASFIITLKTHKRKPKKQL